MRSSPLVAQFGLAAAAVVLASCLSILYARSPGHEPVVLATHAGEPAPAFRLKDVNGQTYDSAALRGKAVVMFFSSVHCTTCGEYQERVRELAQAYRDDPRVQFLALNQDVATGDQQRLLEVRVLAKVSDVPFPTLLDVGAKTARQFGSKPAQFAVLDERGILRYLGGFDDSLDPTKVTRHYVADQLRLVLDDMPTAIASR